MMNLLGAVVIAASALSSSAALAQAALSNPDECQAEFASCTGLGTGSTPTGSYRQRRTAYRQPAAATECVLISKKKQGDRVALVSSLSKPHHSLGSVLRHARPSRYRTARFVWAGA